MESLGNVERLESLADVHAAGNVQEKTLQFLGGRTGIASELADHLSAYNATDDLLPYFGDYRLAHTESYLQLKNSVCLAFQGYYSQALSTLRIVCELSLLQASLPEGFTAPPGEYNVVLPVGFGAGQQPTRKAETLEQWAIEGCRTPDWKSLLDGLMGTSNATNFNLETAFSERFNNQMLRLNPYVHVRGYAKSATGLSSGNMLRFSESALMLFIEEFKSTAVLTVTVLLLSFLAQANVNPDATAGFIDRSDLSLAVAILPARDAGLLLAINENLRSDGSA